MVPITTCAHSSDGELMSQCPLLLQTTVATNIFYLSLLRYTVAMGPLPMAIVAYDPMLQCLLVVVVADIFFSSTG
jgi:hypothetical protein